MIKIIMSIFVINMVKWYSVCVAVFVPKLCS